MCELDGACDMLPCARITSIRFKGTFSVGHLSVATPLADFALTRSTIFYPRFIRAQGKVLHASPFHTDKICIGLKTTI